MVPVGSVEIRVNGMWCIFYGGIGRESVLSFMCERLSSTSSMNDNNVKFIRDVTH
jgi:hypothetical protein